MKRLTLYVAITVVTFAVGVTLVWMTYFTPQVDKVEVPAEIPTNVSPAAPEHVTPPTIKELIQLPAAVRKKLDKRFPGWRFAHINDEIRRSFQEHSEHPEFIEGDFDGNEQLDCAILIEHGTVTNNGGTSYPESHVLAFLKKGKHYKMYVLEDGYSSNSDRVLSLFKKGDGDEDYATDKEFTYANDAIFLGYWEKAGVSYVYEKGRFRSITTSD